MQQQLNSSARTDGDTLLLGVCNTVTRPSAHGDGRADAHSRPFVSVSVTSRVTRSMAAPTSLASRDLECGCGGGSQLLRAGGCGTGELTSPPGQDALALRVDRRHVRPIRSARLRTPIGEHASVRDRACARPTPAVAAHRRPVHAGAVRRGGADASVRELTGQRPTAHTCTRQPTELNCSPSKAGRGCLLIWYHIANALPKSK
eukprot:349747-Chlamydomonas_euryale.AAC.2